MHLSGADLAGRLRPGPDRRRRRRRDAVDPSRLRGRKRCIDPRRADRCGRAENHQCAAEEGSRGGPDPLAPGRREREGRFGRDHHRSPPPDPDAGEGRAAFPGDQRERFGHQKQIRQYLRLPPQPDRRHQARARRHAFRQDGHGLRLRRRRQGVLRCATSAPA